MFKQSVEVSLAPHVVITECVGDLVIRGAEAAQVTIRPRDGGNDVDVQQEGDTLTVVARTDCYLTCPHGTTLTIHTVRSDLKVLQVLGPLTVGPVYGDVQLNAVGPTTLEQCYGDLSAQGVAGNLTIRSVASDVRVSGAQGGLFVESIGGSLHAEGLEQGLTVGTVGADVRLGPPFTPGATYQLKVGSDLRVTLPRDASVRFLLRSGGRVRSSVPGLAVSETNGQAEAVLGNGEALLQAEVGGHVRLRAVDAEATGENFDVGFARDMDDWSVAIESRIAQAMAKMEMRLEETLGHLDSVDFRQRADRATEQAQRAVERATEQARRAAEHEAEQARLRAERAERRWQRVSGQRSQPRREQVSDEERMRVLHMVEQGKLTPEQAAELLSALEGR